MLNGILRVKHNGSVVEDVDFLGTKLTCFDGFNFDERAESEVYAEVVGNFVIGRFLR